MLCRKSYRNSKRKILEKNNLEKLSNKFPKDLHEGFSEQVPKQFSEKLLEKNPGGTSEKVRSRKSFLKIWKELALHS